MFDVAQIDQKDSRANHDLSCLALRSEVLVKTKYATGCGAHDVGRRSARWRVKLMVR